MLKKYTLLILAKINYCIIVRMLIFQDTLVHVMIQMFRMYNDLTILMTAILNIWMHEVMKCPSLFVIFLKMISSTVIIKFWGHIFYRLYGISRFSWLPCLFSLSMLVHHSYLLTIQNWFPYKDYWTAKFIIPYMMTYVIKYLSYLLITTKGFLLALWFYLP